MSDPKDTPITCALAASWIPRYIAPDDPLSCEEARAFERHVEGCDACRAALERALDELPAPPGFTPLPQPSDEAMRALWERARSESGEF